MNARRLALAIVAWLCLLAGGLLFSSAPALALRGHEFKTSFGAGGSGAGQFKEPSGVAVNEATGDVYVVDKGNNRLEYFSSQGTYEGEFNGSGLLLNEGVEAGSRPGETLTGRFEKPEDVAVDNSCYLHEQETHKALSSEECESLDPSNGDVYVMDVGHEAVDKFSSTGAYVSQITSAGPVFSSYPEGEHGLAVAANGELWVAEEHHRLGENFSERGFANYSNALVNKFINFQYNGDNQAAGLALAIDSHNDLYLLQAPRFGEPITKHTIEKYDSNDECLSCLKQEGGFYSGELSAAAVELSTDDVYVGSIGTVARLSPEGSLIESFETAGMHSAGVGVSSANENVYVADSSANVVDVFALEKPSGPKVENEMPSLVTASSATLEAEVNPHGANTSYHFEYGSCVTQSSCATSSYGTSAPVPDGSAGSSFDLRSVSVPLPGLSPHTAYHFRLVAHNEPAPGHVEEAVGPEDVFVTQAVGGELVLPDGRAWEMVSSPEKRGSLIRGLESGEFGVIQASASGSAISYIADAPTEAEPQGYSNFVQIFSTRDANGWTAKDIAAPHEAETAASTEGFEYRFFSSDLSSSIVQPFGHFVPASSPAALAPGEASEQTPFLRKDYVGGNVSDLCTISCYRPLVTGKPGYANVPEGTRFGNDKESQSGKCLFCGPLFVGATSDLAHVVLSSEAALTETPVAAAGGALYEWSNGNLQLVSVLPASEGGGPAPAPELGTSENGASTRAARNAISSDGRRIVFAASTGLYLRDMAKGQKGETVRLDVAQVVVGESLTPDFQIASSDGSRVFFTDSGRLTPNSGASQLTRDLYECVIVEIAGELRCELSDLTPRPVSGEPADVQGIALGASDDGSRIYFVANGIQGEAAGAVHGTCKGQAGVRESCNLYMYYKGKIALVAVLSGEDYSDWDDPSRQTARVSPNGEWLAFMSQRALTGYDNSPENPNACQLIQPGLREPRPCSEVYLYNSASERLVCASCNPSNARPTGPANVPGWTPYTLGSALYQSRYLSDSGRLFFNSPDALVPQDVDGVQDVYEYEPAGVGNCETSSVTFSERSGGCVGLISSGSSIEESSFLDASETGGDVFFLTSSKLVGQDFDTAPDVYDAHECAIAGEPCFAPAPIAPPQCTTADACRSAPALQPSVFGAPSSGTFSGAGNPAPPGSTTSTGPKRLTRAQKLSRALKACKAKKNRNKRKLCERSARHRYAAKASGKANAKRGSR
jgi:DNA-binding beta-propeller fold protein YncE